MHCDKLWYRNNHYYCHTKTCLTTVRESFSGGVYHNPYTIFEKLKQIEIQVPKQDCFYPYYACYNFETYLYRDQLPENGPLIPTRNAEVESSDSDTGSSKDEHDSAAASGATPFDNFLSQNTVGELKHKTKL